MSLMYSPSSRPFFLPHCRYRVARILDNHLGNTRAAKSLASNKGLALESSKAVADGRQQQENCRSNQARAHDNGAQKLDNGHGEVGACSNVVGADLADEFVEFGGRRADSEQQRHFDKQDDER